MVLEMGFGMPFASPVRPDFGVTLCATECVVSETDCNRDFNRLPAHLAIFVFSDFCDSS